jgi:hypothetical protein
MSARTSTAERLAPLAGLVFVATFVVGFAIGGGTPDSTDHTGKVVRYWLDHRDRQIAASLVLGIGTLFLIWYAGSLRARLRVAEGGTGRLAAVAFGGALVMAVGIDLLVAMSFAAADTAKDVPPSVTQTLSVLSNDVFIPLSVGSAALFLAAGLVTVRTRALPGWLGWVAIVVGVASVTPVGFFGVLVGVVWIAITSVLLYLRPLDAAGAPPPPAAAPAV